MAAAVAVACTSPAVLQRERRQRLSAATKRNDTLRFKADLKRFQTFPEPRIGSGNVPTNFSKLSAFEVA
jgi:hypothetical protein